MITEAKMSEMLNMDFWNELMSNAKLHEAGWEMIIKTLSEKVIFIDEADKEIFLGISKLMHTDAKIQQKFIQANANFLYEVDPKKVS